MPNPRPKRRRVCQQRATSRPRRPRCPRRPQWPAMPAMPVMPAAIARRPVVVPLSPDRYGFHFTGEARLKEKIERARALARHQLPSGDLAGLVELAFDRLLRDLEQQRFGVGRRSRRRVSEAADSTECNIQPSVEVTTDRKAALPSRVDPDAQNLAEVIATVLSPPPPGGCAAKSPSTDATRALASPPAPAVGARRVRHVPAAVAREVYVRDQGRCSFVSDDGRCCGSQDFLELDHIVPWAKGGESTAANLRLLCRTHNQHRAFSYFGRAYIAARIARSRA